MSGEQKQGAMVAKNSNKEMKSVVEKITAILDDVQEIEGRLKNMKLGSDLEVIEEARKSQRSKLGQIFKEGSKSGLMADLRVMVDSSTESLREQLNEAHKEEAQLKASQDALKSGAILTVTTQRKIDKLKAEKEELQNDFKEEWKGVDGEDPDYKIAGKALAKERTKLNQNIERLKEADENLKGVISGDEYKANEKKLKELSFKKTKLFDDIKALEVNVPLFKRYGEAANLVAGGLHGVGNGEIEIRRFRQEFKEASEKNRERSASAPQPSLENAAFSKGSNKPRAASVEAPKVAITRKTSSTVKVSSQNDSSTKESSELRSSSEKLAATAQEFKGKVAELEDYKNTYKAHFEKLANKLAKNSKASLPPPVTFNEALVDRYGITPAEMKKQELKALEELLQDPNQNSKNIERYTQWHKPRTSVKNDSLTSFPTPQQAQKKAGFFGKIARALGFNKDKVPQAVPVVNTVQPSGTPGHKRSQARTGNNL